MAEYETPEINLSPYLDDNYISKICLIQGTLESAEGFQLPGKTLNIQYQLILVTSSYHPLAT